MTTNTYFLEELQGQLKRAFKQMAKATESAQEGSFQMATYYMTVALQYWIKCQNVRDRYIKDEDVEGINWKFFAKKALAAAKEELKEESNND